MIQIKAKKCIKFTLWGGKKVIKGGGGYDKNPKKGPLRGTPPGPPPGTPRDPPPGPPRGVLIKDYLSLHRKAILG